MFLPMNTPTDTLPAVTSPAPAKTDARHPLNGVRISLYGAQIADAMITSNALKQCGGRENFAPLRPFSHGGPATYAVGFALFDLATHALLRRTKFAQVFEVLQIGGSAVGLGMDSRAKC
jgi:hypothetical protein